MNGTIIWQGDACFQAESGSGHQVTIDGPPDHGGKNQGMRPMEMVLMGMGGCTAFDVINILRRSRQQIADCRVELRADRADGIPSVFTHIHVHFIITGTNIKEPLVKRAVSLTAEKYCSASIMLEKGGVEITHDYEIREAAHD